MTVEDWIISLTHNQESLSNLPICPYAKQAYINKRYHIIEIEYDDLTGLLEVTVLDELGGVIESITITNSDEDNDNDFDINLN